MPTPTSKSCISKSVTVRQRYPKLMDAMYKKDIWGVRSALEANPPTKKDGNILLDIAARNNQLECVQELLAYSDARHMRSSALRTAFYHKNQAMIDLLVPVSDLGGALKAMVEHQEDEDSIAQLRVLAVAQERSILHEATEHNNSHSTKRKM